MKKYLLFSILVLVSILLICGNGIAQNKSPFNLPAAIPVPSWVTNTDWQNPNIHEVETLIRDYKYKNIHSPKQAPGIVGKQLDNELEEDPYITAYIRWRNSMQPFVQSDGTILYDKEKLRQKLIQSINDNNDELSGHSAQKKTTSSNWTLLGPVQTYDALSGGLKNEQSNMYCIAVAPSNPMVLYAASEPGTMYRSADKGLHWTAISDNIYSCEAISIAINPTNENALFCFDGISNTLLTTTTGGTSWSAVSSYTGGGGDRIIILPGGTNRILITGTSAIYYSDDNGTTWTTTTGTGGMTDIVANPHTADTIYAAGANSSGNLKIMRSVDMGTTFTDVTGSLSTINTGGARLGVSVANSNYVYCASIGTTASPKIIKSTDMGATWNITVSSNDSTSLTGNSDTTGLGMSNGQGYYDFDLVVSPLNANYVIVGTTSTYRSIDGGFNFRPLGGYNGNLYLHPDLQQAVANGSDLYLATDGGVNYSSDFFANPANWSIRNNGIRSGDFWGFGQGWDEDIVVGGRYHNGDMALYENYGAGNSLRLGGGEDATGHVFHGHSRTAGFRDIGTLVMPSSLAGAIEWGAPDVPNSLWPQDDYYGLFCSKLMIDPRYSNVFYLGNGTELWKSSNSGASYIVLHDFGTGNKVWRFDIARSNYNYIYLCATNGVYKSTDGGSTWSLLTIPTTYQYYNSDIAVDPLNENNVYLTMAGGSAGNKVFKSTNAGSTWTNITGTVFSGLHPAFLQFHGGTNGGVYTITNDHPTKVFYRDNSMTDWVDFSTGITQNMVAREGGQIFYRDNKMRLAGNCSIWESPLYATGKPVAQPMADKEFIGCSHDTVHFYDYSMYTGAGATRLWTFPGAYWVSNDTSRTPMVLYPGPGSYSVSLKITDALMDTNTRTVNNMIVYNNDMCNPDTVAGKCLQMNGTGQTLNLGIVNINSDSFSISCWVQPRGNQSSFSQIISHDIYPGSGGYGFGMGYTFAGYTPNLELCYTDSIVNYSNYSGLFCDSTKWNFVVLSYAPNGVTMYLNGIPSVVNPGPMPVIDLSQSPFYVNFDAQEGQGSSFNGKVEEVKFYSHALSQSEVREKMHLIQHNAATELGLLKYFQFNQYDAATGVLHDAMGNYYVNAPDTNIVSSTAPVSTGTVYRNAMVNSAGLNGFAAADINTYLPTGGIFPDGEVVAFHLYSNPDVNPNTRPIVPGYFVMNNYGANATFSQPDSIVFGKLNIGTSAFTPTDFHLFQRPFGAFGNTWGTVLDSASNFVYSPLNSRLTWSAGNNITGLSCQFVMVNYDSSVLGTKKVTVPPDQWQVSDLYPNPATQWTRVNIHNPGTEGIDALMTITDYMGSQLSRMIQHLSKGDNTVMLQLKQLVPGSYIISFKLSDSMIVSKTLLVE